MGSNHELELWAIEVRERIAARTDEAEHERLARLARGGEAATSQRAGPIVGARTWLGHTLVHVGLVLAEGRDVHAGGHTPAEERHHRAGQTV